MENLPLLMQLVPELSDLVWEDVGVSNNNNGDSVKKQESEETKARFHHAFRSFFRVISNAFVPLVQFLDDLQWADIATLDLLPVLVAYDTNLLLLGAYRSNEVDPLHPLSRFIHNRKKADSNNICEIFKGNLNIDQTNEIVMSLLSADDHTITTGLANICHKRSDGNFFRSLYFWKCYKRKGCCSTVSDNFNGNGRKTRSCQKLSLAPS